MHERAREKAGGASRAGRVKSPVSPHSPGCWLLRPIPLDDGGVEYGSDHRFAGRGRHYWWDRPTAGRFCRDPTRTVPSPRCNVPRDWSDPGTRRHLATIGDPREHAQAILARGGARDCGRPRLVDRAGPPGPQGLPRRVPSAVPKRLGPWSRVTTTLTRALDAARDGTAYGLPLASGPPITRDRR